MSGRIVSEQEFRDALIFALEGVATPAFVTGPGRSGAIAAVYASHHLGVPFVPYTQRAAQHGALIVDTAMQSGRTIRKASRLYGDAPFVVVFREPPRLRFWYEELSLTRGGGNEYRRVAA